MAESETSDVETSRDRAFSVSSDHSRLFGDQGSQDGVNPNVGTGTGVEDMAAVPMPKQVKTKASMSFEDYAIPDPFEATPKASPRSLASFSGLQNPPANPPPSISHSEPSPPLVVPSTPIDPLQDLRSSIQNTPLGVAAQRPPPLSPTPPLSQGSFLLERAAAAVWPVRSPGRSREGSRAGSRSSSRAPGSRRSREVSAAGSVTGLRRPSGVAAGDEWYPTLVAPELFMPLPNTDPLQTLLSKYVPPAERPQRDTSGRWQGRTIDDMVASSSWRSLATFAQDNLLSSPATSLSNILQLWFIRLHALLSLLLPHQHLNELTALFTAIGQARIDKRKIERAMPFELEVSWAKRKAYITKEAGGAGEGRGQGPKDLQGAVEDLGVLDRQCRSRAKRERERTKCMEAEDERSAQNTPSEAEGMAKEWMRRSRRVKVIMAGLLTDMREYPPAIALLEPLSQSSPSPSIHLSLIYLNLAAGTIATAQALLANLLASDASEEIKRAARAAVLSANSNWKGVVEIAGGVDGSASILSANNLAVALLNDGQLEEAAKMLDDQISAGPDAAVYTEPMLFNLTTMYELQSGSATQKKVTLLKQMAGAVGDGLRPGCLKLS